MALVQWCADRSADGFSLVLWSCNGEQHARRAAEATGRPEIWDHILSKPGYIVDDRGWSWVRDTRRLRPSGAGGERG